MERETVTRVVHWQDGPPENELPAVIVSGISWGGAEVAVAIPALLLYSTGIELLIMYRSRWSPVVTGDDLTATDYASAATLRLRDFIEKLNGLKVNGHPVTELGGESFNDHGYNQRAWVSASALVDGDQILTLEWPGIEQAEHRIARATIVDAVPKIKTLW